MIALRPGLCPACLAACAVGGIGFAAANPPCPACVRRATAEPDAVELLRHARKHYTDRMVSVDAACLTSVTTDAEVLGILKAYLKARRSAPGFTRGFKGAGDGNTDRAIPAEVMAGLVGRAKASSRRRGQTRACEFCGLDFTASRSTARFCGATCRQQAKRTEDNARNGVLSVTSAVNVQVTALPKTPFGVVDTGGQLSPERAVSVTFPKGVAA